MSIYATVPAAAGTLSAADRCDGCSARALYRVTLPPGIDYGRGWVLLMCAHHFTKSAAKLDALSGIEVVFDPSNMHDGPPMKGAAA